MAENSILYLSFYIIFTLISVNLADDEINQKTNSRCDQICNEKDLNLLEIYKTDCQRGCRYFNIEFLTTSGDVDKVTDLNYTQNQCKLSCNEAYEELSKRDACHVGCGKMYELQSKAPYIHGWLVYMGASDRSMVLMQPDFDLVADDDWILLDAIFHPRDYENVGDSYKLTETRIQTMPIYPTRKNTTVEFCMPPWMWMISIVTILFLIARYGSSIKSLIPITYEYSDDNSDDENLPTSIQIHKDKKPYDEFIVAAESYFYPSPSIPPPKYSEIEEEILINEYLNETNMETKSNLINIKA